MRRLQAIRDVSPCRSRFAAGSRFVRALVAGLLVAGPLLAREPEPSFRGPPNDPFRTVEAIHPFTGDPLHDEFLRTYLYDRPDNPMDALKSAFPDAGVRPLFLGARPGWSTVVALAVPLVAVVALAWSWLIGVAGADRRRRARAVAWVAGLSVVLGLAAWWTSPVLWHSWWTMPHEGNTGRTLQQFYQLFHSEFLRSELVRFLWWLDPGEPLPPVAFAARLTAASLAASIPVLVAAGLVLGAGVLASLVGVAAIFASPLVSQYALSDHPIGGIALFTGLMFLAVSRAWYVGEGRRLRIAVGVSLVALQGVLAELRPETLALWLVADLVILAAWWRGISPREACERGSARTAAFLRSRCATPPGLVAVVIGVVALLLLPALFLWLPFRVFENPRVFSYFPFLASGALWGLFAPGFLGMAETMAPATVILAGLGLAFGILRPLGAWGVGIGVVASLSATWVLGHSQPQWVYARLTASLVPVMVLLGVQAMGRMPRAARVGGAAFLVGLSVVLPLFGSSIGGGHWVGRLTVPPLRFVDNAIEAHTVFDALAGSEGGCLVAPVLAAERAQTEEVPPDRRRIDLLVLDRDFAARVPLGIRDDDGEALADAVVAAGSSCERARLYLGLDCSLQGMTFCRALRGWFTSGPTTMVEGEIYTAPANYGRRGDRRELQVIDVPSPDRYRFIRGNIPREWR